MSTPRLITIPISHFCEKARWALDRAGVDYVEERHVQGFSVLRARQAGGGLTTPVLVTGDSVLGESEDIVVWADRFLPSERRLVPEDPSERAEAVSLARSFDHGLGPASRRLVYGHLIGHKAALLELNNQGVPAWEAKWLDLFFEATKVALRVRLGAPLEPTEADEGLCRVTYDAVAGRLADGRPYLCGDRFTIADLTFAALSAPLVGPERYGVRLGRVEDLPAGAGELIERFRAHPAGRFALALTEAERPVPADRSRPDRAGTTPSGASRRPARSPRRTGQPASR